MTTYLTILITYLFFFFLICFIRFATKFSNSSDNGGLYESFAAFNFYFPTASYETNSYWDSGTTQFGFIFYVLLMFVYPINLNVSALVEEKAGRIKEGMKMMGARNDAYWLSWILWFGFEQTLISICVAFIGKWTYVFRYSDPWVIFFWVWGFSLSLSAFSTLLSTGMLVYFYDHLRLDL